MTIKITTQDLLGIACAAEIWYKGKDEIFHTFGQELEAATRLKKELWKTEWDDDAQLIIMEMPF